MFLLVILVFVALTLVGYAASGYAVERQQAKESLDRRLSSMAKVGRYRMICSEPLVVKPPHWMAGHRLARVVIYDYAADRTVDACVDLDAGVVAHLELTRAQPMLSRDEEALAVSIAMVDERVREKLALGDVPQSTLHYWGRAADDLAYARRSAAVVFGRADGHASIVAIVDLLENMVTRVTMFSSRSTTATIDAWPSARPNTTAAERRVKARSSGPRPQ